jgi:hypothetical protein
MEVAMRMKSVYSVAGAVVMAAVLMMGCDREPREGAAESEAGAEKEMAVDTLGPVTEAVNRLEQGAREAVQELRGVGERVDTSAVKQRIESTVQDARQRMQAIAEEAGEEMSPKRIQERINNVAEATEERINAIIDSAQAATRE